MNQDAHQPLVIQTVEELFRLHQPMLYRLAYHLVRDPEAAKDLVQDVFLQVWKNRNTIQFGSSTRSYLYKATTHAALNYLESSKRKTLLQTQIRQQSSEATDSSPESLDTRELEAKIQEAIDRLPPRCRVIFLLSRQEGLKYQQIAEQLDLSLKTVENQMGIALERLRHDLKPFLTREYLLTLLLLLALSTTLL